MGGFLKVFLRGLICTLLLPFIVVFLVGYTIYLIFVYLIMLIRNLIVFFMGGNIEAMKEDVEAKKILANQQNVENNMTDMLAGLMHTAIQQNPEVVRAMAQQQIASQTNPQPVSQPQPTAQVDAIDVKETEVNNND